MADTRYFTVEEANRLVPQLEAAFQRMLALRVQLRSAGKLLEELGEPTDRAGLERADGTPEARAARGRARGLLETLSEELEELAESGVQVKDLDVGLCDFVARREGRDVLLCWRLGEKEVAYWHEVHTGFSGRQPIDGAFAGTLH